MGLENNRRRIASIVAGAKYDSGTRQWIVSESAMRTLPAERHRTTASDASVTAATTTCTHGCNAMSKPSEGETSESTPSPVPSETVMKAIKPPGSPVEIRRAIPVLRPIPQALQPEIRRAQPVDEDESN